jgi:hypothetical protein
VLYQAPPNNFEDQKKKNPKKSQKDTRSPLSRDLAGKALRNGVLLSPDWIRFALTFVRMYLYEGSQVIFGVVVHLMSLDPNPVPSLKYRLT